MKIITIDTILNEYQEFFTANEIDQLRKVTLGNSDFNTQVKALHAALFAEEKENLDSKKYMDPAYIHSDEYTDRIRKKRETFGISSNYNNIPIHDNTSELFCREVIRHTKKYKELADLKEKNAKQVVFVDMDDVLVNFQSGIDKISEDDRKKYGPDHFDNVPGIFALMEPYEGAIEGYRWLCNNFDTYILSTASWDNPSAWKDKLLWVKKYLPEEARKRLILSHNKHLAKGDFLIDDRTANGAGNFSGKHIHFKEKGKGFEDWNTVIAYMKTLV